MTSSGEWLGPVGDVWAKEWRRTDRAFGGLAPTLDAAILAAAPTGPFRALDIGCGAGGTALALAASRPDAQVLGIDISPALIAVARERAAGAGNLRFLAGDVVQAVSSEAPFDLLLSRHGVMFFPDPLAAFTALRRTTRPGGALIFSCFANPADNGFAAPLARALGLAPPLAGAAPGPFAFAREETAARLLTAAGWDDAQAQRIAFPYRVGAGADPLSDAVAFLSRIGPAAAAMRSADPARRAELVAGLRAYLADHVGNNAVDLPAAAWLWSARA